MMRRTCDWCTNPPTWIVTVGATTKIVEACHMHNEAVLDFLNNSIGIPEEGEARGLSVTIWRTA